MRRLLAFAAALLTAGMALAAPPQKVFRYSFPAAETGFDPARINDIYSRTVTAHIFDGLYQFDPLRRPFLVRPNVADGMPQHSDDYRTWTVRLRPPLPLQTAETNDTCRNSSRAYTFDKCTSITGITIAEIASRNATDV